MNFYTSSYNWYFWFTGSVSCTNDESNPTPVYVVEGGEVVLQCAFESSELSWQVYSASRLRIVSIGGDVVNDSKYSVSKNPSTGLYYRLHIKNVGVSDLMKYSCQELDNCVNKHFYIKLDFLGGLIICQGGGAHYILVNNCTIIF